MRLPTFVGIGVPRAGSTWIAYQLSQHPDVYMAPGKELFFFNRYFDRDVEWYSKRFPGAIGKAYQAIGEFTPEYLYCELCPNRMVSIGSIDRLIVSLRNPVERAYSHYGLMVRSMNYRKSFEEALNTTSIVAMGFYSRYLQNYLKYFGRNQLQIFIFERTIATDTLKTKQKLAQFLEIDATLFPENSGKNGQNKSYKPSAQYAFSLYAKLMQGLLKVGLHTWVKRIRDMRVDRVFGVAGYLPPMKQETRSYLFQQYQTEIDKLEALLEVDLNHWKNG